MKTIFTRTQAPLAIGMILLLSFASDAKSQSVNTVFWDVPDPFTEAYGGAGGESGQSNITLVDAATLSFPGITDADANGNPRGQIGQVIFDAPGTPQPGGDSYNQFTNIGARFEIGTGAGQIDPAFIGTPFRLEVDYFVPQNPDGTAVAFDVDAFFLEIDTNDTNTLDGNSGGFTFGSDFMAGWNTVSMEYTIPASAGGSSTSSITTLIVSSDGAFNGPADANGDGVTPHMYLDNIRLIGNYDENEPIGGLLGDFDGDMDVDLDDLDQYNGNLGEAATGALAALDLDGSGTVDLADFQQHYETLVETSNGGKGTAAGDVNLDGVVNVLGDAFALVGNLNNAATSWSQGDLNADGTVNVLGDAFLLVGNLGADNGGGATAPSTSAVPEPGSWSLLALAGLTVLGRRRR